MSNATICQRCLLQISRRANSHASRTARQGFSIRRTHATKQPLPPALKAHEIDELLSNPTWDVKSLLPTAEQIAADEEITPQKLRHLLRLSALPYPQGAEEEAKLSQALKAQLHFVRDVQKVDTGGVEPLVALRDETPEAQQENEITLSSLQDALSKEKTRGKFHKRTRRMHDAAASPTADEQWDVLGQAPKKVGKFFVVED